MNWIYISEQLPPEHSQIIFLCEDEDGKYPICGLVQKDRSVFFNLEDYGTEYQSELNGVVAWQPLPKP